MKLGYRLSTLALASVFSFAAFGQTSTEARVARVAGLVAVSAAQEKPRPNPCVRAGYVCRPISPGYSCSDIGGRPIPLRCGGLGASCCDR